MQHSYHIFAKLECFHAFGSSAEKSLRWVPDAFTEHFLTKHQLIYRTTENVLELACPIENGNTSSQVETNFLLNFSIQSEDPFFRNYTAHSGSSNLLFAKVIDIKSPEKFVFSEKELLQKKNPVTSSKEASLKITGSNGEFFIPAIDRLIPFGIYSQDENKFVSTPNQPKTIAWIQIHGENDLLQIDSPIEKKKYSLQFEVSSSHWRYHFPANAVQHLEGLKITNGKVEEVFEPRENRKLPDGRETISFDSIQSIPFTDQSTHNFQLKKNVGIDLSPEALVIQALPGPEKHSLTTVSDEKRITEIFVHI